MKAYNRDVERVYILYVRVITKSKKVSTVKDNMIRVIV